LSGRSGARKEYSRGEPIEQQRIEGDSRGLDRSLAFSDGAFAITLTLLVLNIEVPEIPENLVAEDLPGELLDLRPTFLSYVLSLAVIGFYWRANHSTLGVIRDHDWMLVWLNSFS
jgi:uncharacterized membrane protein